MQEVSVADFKARFSDMLDKVRRGERIAIQYGRRKQTVALLIPPTKDKALQKRPLGILKGKASFKIRKDFKMAEDDFCLNEMSS